MVKKALQLLGALCIVMCMVLMYSCQHQQNAIYKIPVNDTSVVIRRLLDSVIQCHGLYQNNPFDNAVIVVYNPILVEHLPTNMPRKFKVMTKDEICDVATKTHRTMFPFPHVIRLHSFTKTDSIYEADVLFTCVIPLYDTLGKPYPNHGVSMFTPKDGERCWFGFLCGIGYDIKMCKQGDTLKLLNTSISFD